MILASKFKQSKEFLQIFGRWKNFLDKLWNSDKIWSIKFQHKSARKLQKIDGAIWKFVKKSSKFTAKNCWIVQVGEVQRNVTHVNLVDLVKSFLTSIYYLVAKIGFENRTTSDSDSDTAENDPISGPVQSENEPFLFT